MNCRETQSSLLKVVLQCAGGQSKFAKKWSLIFCAKTWTSLFCTFCLVYTHRSRLPVLPPVHCCMLYAWVVWHYILYCFSRRFRFSSFFFSGQPYLIKFFHCFPNWSFSWFRPLPTTNYCCLTIFCTATVRSRLRVSFAQRSRSLPIKPTLLFMFSHRPCSLSPLSSPDVVQHLFDMIFHSISARVI